MMNSRIAVALGYTEPQKDSDHDGELMTKLLNEENWNVIEELFYWKTPKGDYIKFLLKWDEDETLWRGHGEAWSWLKKNDMFELFGKNLIKNNSKPKNDFHAGGSYGEFICNYVFIDPRECAAAFCGILQNHDICGD